jgi:hypothetical protein
VGEFWGPVTESTSRSVAGHRGAGLRLDCRKLWAPSGAVPPIGIQQSWKERNMSTEADAAGRPSEQPADIPVFTRKSTGLVREVGLFDMTVFNAVSTSPIGAALVFALFALVVFPRGNPPSVAGFHE